MEHLPPVGWADVATKRDLDHLRTVMTSEMDAKLHRLESRLLRAMLVGNFASAATVGGLVFAAVRLA
jgi:hypothetical protein